MDTPEMVTLEDRTMLIGVLADLSAAFFGTTGEGQADARSMFHMTDRYRRDSAVRLGRAPSDEECRAELEEQVSRLRLPIGEETG